MEKEVYYCFAYCWNGQSSHRQHTENNCYKDNLLCCRVYIVPVWVPGLMHQSVAPYLETGGEVDFKFSFFRDILVLNKNGVNYGLLKCSQWFFLTQNAYLPLCTSPQAAFWRDVFVPGHS